ncbi:MAG: disulfide bond formation protein DsbC [Acidobacteriota bacterium]
MKIVTVAVTFCALLASGAAQKLPWETGTNGASQQLVHYLYPQQVTLPAGKSATIEMHFRVNEGLHINSHTPLQKSLIRTELIEAEPQGINVAAVDFPPGASYAFPADPSMKLSVYSGEFVLRMHLTAQRGNHLLDGQLRYQACDNHTCFPPRKLPVAVDVIGQ